MQCSSEDETSIDISQDGPKNSSSISVGSINSDHDTDSNKPFYRFFRPPYLKPKPEEDGEISLEQPTKSSGYVVENEINYKDDLVTDAKTKPNPSRGNTPEVLHSHSKLPDYEELAARIAALKQS